MGVKIASLEKKGRILREREAPAELAMLWLGRSLALPVILTLAISIATPSPKPPS